MKDVKSLIYPGASITVYTCVYKCWHNNKVGKELRQKMG